MSDEHEPTPEPTGPATAERTAPVDTTDATPTVPVEGAPLPAAPEQYHVDPPPPPEAMPSAPATGGMPPAAPDPAPGAAWRRGITVPAWALALLGLLVLAGGAFLLGRATADDDSVRGDLAASIRNDGSGDAGSPSTTRPIGRPLLGVSVRDAPDQGGAQLTRVVPGSPADDAGLRFGDVIVVLDGTTISSANDLVEAVAAHERGDEVQIAFRRGDDRQTVNVVLGS